MASPTSFKRTVSEERFAKELRTPPPPPIPERLTRAFPEMKEYDQLVQEWSRKSNEAVRIALSEIQETPQDYVAIFEAELA